MTDIVFLLLIFFIIVSTMVSPNALKVLLPKSAAKNTSPQTVSVTITPELEYYINGKRVTESMLESSIQGKMEGSEKTGIILHCDKKVALEHAVKIMDIANRNKYELVLATSPK